MNRAPLGDLGPGDLLRALALAGEDEARQRRYAHLLGYGYAPKPANRPENTGFRLDQTGGASGETTDTAAATLPTRFRARLYGLLEEPEGENLPAPLDLPRASQGLSEADCLPRQPLATVRLAPLVPPKRLWPALKPLLQTWIPGGLDLPALQRHLARAHLPRVLPRRVRPREAAPLVVVLDQARHLAPLALDLQLVAAEIHRLAGHAGLHGYRVAGHPHALQACWDAGRRDAQGRPHIPVGARVLIVGDLGQARREGAEGVAEVWRAWCAGLEKRGCRIHIVSPVSHAPGWALAAFHTLAGARLHCPRPTPHPPQLDAALARYQCALAFAVQVEPELLRDLRCSDPALAPYPELESLHRQSPHTRHAEQPTLHPAAAARLRPGLKTWSTAAQRRLLHGLRACHAGDYRAVEMTEILLWSAHAGEAARDLEHEAIDVAHRWFAGFEQESEAAPGNPQVRAFADAVWGLAAHDSPMQARYSPWFSAFWALDEHRRQAPPPPGLSPVDLARVLGAAPSSFDCLLVQQGDWLLARLPGELETGQSPLAGPYPTCSIRVGQAGRERRLVYTGGDLPLARLSQGEIDMGLDGWRLRVGELTAPWWALEVGRNRRGAYCLAPLLAEEKPLRLQLPIDLASLFHNRLGTFFGDAIRSCEFRYGLDTYGWYADMELLSLRHTQRLRWIPPGDFLMGSPADEPESHANEHPRHRVILTKGYWLADTACTQGLWQAVMGENPSHFKGDPELPVESISWDDTQIFLAKLAELTGLKAALPSEAEWEYACRAGTTTPFWWGDRLTTEDANYDGNHPYDKGEKGEYRKRMVPVKTFKPNPWGLWQMHGNVWEWCRDGQRTYGKDLVVDPEGPPGNRALRGGSWFRDGRSLRAADRDTHAPGSRGRIIGFRFFLRSPGPAARRAGE